MWIEITVKNRLELVNITEAERVYENEEGVTCIEMKDGVIETTTSVASIRDQLFRFRIALPNLP